MRNCSYIIIYQNVPENWKINVDSISLHFKLGRNNMKLRLNNMAYYLLFSFMYNSRITIMSFFFGKKVNMQLNQNQIKTPRSHVVLPRSPYFHMIRIRFQGRWWNMIIIQADLMSINNFRWMLVVLVGSQRVGRRFRWKSADGWRDSTCKKFHDIRIARLPFFLAWHWRRDHLMIFPLVALIQVLSWQ